MTHLLVVVLLIVFAPIALARIMPLLSFVVRLVAFLVASPFIAVWGYGYFLYAICREFDAEAGREFLRAATICGAVAVLMAPLFWF
jgi:hypothetical protein